MHSLNHQHLVKLYGLVLDMDLSLVSVRLLGMMGRREEMDGWMERGKGREGLL